MDKEPVHTGMPKSVQKCKVALIDTALEIKKTEIESKIQIVLDSDSNPIHQFLGVMNIFYNSTAKLKDLSPLDIYADENSLCSNDIHDIKNAFDGINIKLMKCGSLEEGKSMIDVARSYDLKVMLGCMVETSIGITAASHLAGDVDVADLDGNLLINNDPYFGVNVVNGRLTLPKQNGCGIKLDPKIKGLI